MTRDLDPEEHSALLRRIERDLIDGYDEELELEFEDRILEAHAPSSAAPDPDADRSARQHHFRELFRLQAELVKLQDWVAHSRHKVVILFEGRDAAGKGGVIKRITQRLNPRVSRVVALPAPSDRERTHWHFQRYLAHLLSLMPYAEVPREPIALPARVRNADYIRQPVGASMIVPEQF